jgi:hypothetical protein
MKYRLTSQLTDPKLSEHIMLKEEWSEHTFRQSGLACLRDSVHKTI